MMNNNTPLLEMRNIKKDFFGNQVLTDINFTLNAGEVLGLVGENGAGKSTLMKLLFGMDVIRETGGYGGDVLINGEKVSFSTPFDALEAGIGMVHQEFSLIPGFTATDNILLNREPKKKNIISEIFGDRLDTLDYKEMAERSEQAIDKMGVKIDAKMVISDMPVGHKQFTEIARELSKDNLKLLILDEPTSGLDPVVRDEILDLFNDFTRDENHSILISSHIVGDLEKLCDYVAFIQKGRLIICEEKDQLLESYGILKCSEEELAELDEQAVAGVRDYGYGVEALVEKCRLPEGYQTEATSLEDIIIFLSKRERRGMK